MVPLDTFLSSTKGMQIVPWLFMYQDVDGTTVPESLPEVRGNENFHTWNI